MAEPGNDQSAKEGDAVALGSATPAMGGVPPYQFVWTVTGLGLQQSFDIANPTFRPAMPGDFIAQLRVTDSTGCQATGSLTVHVSAADHTTTSAPSVEMPQATASGCGGPCGAMGTMSLALAALGHAGLRFRLRRQRH